jgi:glycosyltransferase involved in cell wall biosynthesis
MERKKYKVLMLADHALSTSGVGTQSRHLINGLLKKGGWSFRQFGAAIKHDNYNTVVVNEDFIIKPVDGFGNPDMLRVTLATEKPDVLLLFTDPRFFIWVWEMEDEIHQICPIAYWHVWDNRPTPRFNDSLYESTDLINCHSHLTYEMVKENFPEKTNFVPHALPEDLYFPLGDVAKKSYRRQLLGNEKADHFIAFWMNRNAKRKRPNDVLLSWQKFMQQLEKQGKKDALLIMHTDPHDSEGPNLQQTAEMLGIQESVLFSNQRVDFEKINIMHNIADVTLNISFAEGFGLGTLESMQCGTPIIAAKTGGLTRQVVDHRDGSENGVALPIATRSLVGSQQVPFIYEDYASVDDAADALLKMYSLNPEERKNLSEKVRSYVTSEFNYQNTIDMWDDTLRDLIENWERDKFTLETM